MNTRDIKLKLLMVQAQYLLVNCMQLLKVDQGSHAECDKFLVVSDRVCARPDVHKFCQTLTLEVDKVISVDLSGFSYSASACFELPLWLYRRNTNRYNAFFMMAVQIRWQLYAWLLDNCTIVTNHQP
ncbi:hypothetical protein MP228_000334 [Amoeboaphelidium protococcarum]|nr:hypothetical protein MP228_000334 [Amoeboaphelidium protococcarum]